MNKQVIKIFEGIKSSDRKITIKLLGDSITHGVGGSGYLADGEVFLKSAARNEKGY